MTLTNTQFALLQESAVDAGMTFYSDYSGRGMFGKTCVGVAGTVDEFVSFILLIADNDRDLANELVYLVTDNMGFDRIYYFPSMQRKDDS
jgi:hypothetical protein